jgi:inosine/xanthosine triphosphatase
MSTKTIKIVVASLNPVKVGAAKIAFMAQFPNQELELIPVSVPSNVRDQPMSDEETRLGAGNRVRNSVQAYSQADYWVGLEGGLETIQDKLLAFAWMAICDRSGTISEARSATLPLPPAVQELVEAGHELGEANDRVFSTINSKQGGGAFGLLTDGLYTREEIYAQTLVLALVPFVNELWPKP